MCEPSVTLPESSAIAMRDRLEGRAHLIDADVDAVDLLLVAHVAGIVGIVVGQRLQRDDFAGVDVDHRARRGLGVEALEPDRELVAQARGSPSRSSESRTGFSASGSTVKPGDVGIGEALLVEIFFHAGDADVVVVDVADHMGADRAVGIDALVLGRKADAGQAEMKDLLLLLRRHMALDPDKALLRAQPLSEFLGVDVGQHRGDELHRLVLVDDAFGLGEHRHGLDVGGEDAAVAVEQIRPRAGDRLVGDAFQRLRRLARQAATSLPPTPR